MHQNSGTDWGKQELLSSAEIKKDAEAEFGLKSTSPLLEDTWGCHT